MRRRHGLATLPNAIVLHLAHDCVRLEQVVGCHASQCAGDNGQAPKPRLEALQMTLKS